MGYIADLTNEQIERLEYAKVAIKDAITEKGVKVSSSATIDKYAAYIKEIGAGGSAKSAITITNVNLNNSSFTQLPITIIYTDESNICTCVNVEVGKNITINSVIGAAVVVLPKSSDDFDIADKMISNGSALYYGANSNITIKCDGYLNSVFFATAKTASIEFYWA